MIFSLLHQFLIKKSNDVVYALEEHSQESMGYVDLPGKSPFISATGTQYLLIAYNVDANSITVAKLKNRNATTITEGWEELHSTFELDG